MSARSLALVTGASAGLGVDFARLLANDGHDLILVARRLERLESLAQALKQNHQVTVHCWAEDLTDESGSRRIAEKLKAQQLNIDVLINNAGFGTFGPFLEQNMDEQMGMIKLNMAALTHLTGLLLPGMVERKTGRILNVASTAAFQPGPLMAVYYATKAYVLSFSEAIGYELRGTGVSVTCLCPGPTRTEFQSAAKLDASRLFDKKHVMDSLSVARAGYKGMMAGKRLVVPGVINKILSSSVRFTPRGLVLPVVQGMQRTKA